MRLKRKINLDTYYESIRIAISLGFRRQKDETNLLVKITLKIYSNLFKLIVENSLWNSLKN